jgi:hypothetical protein
MITLFHVALATCDRCGRAASSTTADSIKEAAQLCLKELGQQGIRVLDMHGRFLCLACLAEQPREDSW